MNKSVNATSSSSFLHDDYDYTEGNSNVSHDPLTNIPRMLSNDTGLYKVHYVWQTHQQMRWKEGWRRDGKM